MIERLTNVSPNYREMILKDEFDQHLKYRKIRSGKKHLPQNMLFNSTTGPLTPISAMKTINSFQLPHKS